ncbi:MAG TPA: polyprenol monophosphomannose synthase [Solirubrobacteraceae bacterium]|nr:polyprenol monophosphomannose synthase [Solirubrobacteraceae bacterium]
MPGVVWLVLPTYNEAENIEPLVEAALPQLAQAAAEGHRILIVDDSSPDGTGRLADQLAAAHDTVEVLHRSAREGLGPAYLAGFARALAAGAATVLQMDADFSHNPADLPRLLEAIAAGADLALGSRYVPGGGVEDWGLLRRIVSRVGCSYARRVLSLGIRDLTGGFKCFRREVLEAIELETVRSHGYCFQVEMTQRALLRGFDVREVPITFHDRQRGHSKMSPRIALEAFIVLPQLRWRSPFR